MRCYPTTRAALHKAPYYVCNFLSKFLVSKPATTRATTSAAMSATSALSGPAGLKASCLAMPAMRTRLLPARPAGIPARQVHCGATQTQDGRFKQESKTIMPKKSVSNLKATQPQQLVLAGAGEASAGFPAYFAALATGSRGSMDEAQVVVDSSKRSGEQQEPRQQGPRPDPSSSDASWSIELFKLGKLAVPLLLQYLIYNSSHLINTSFVGHLEDPVLLSSMVLATSLSMATGYSIINGIASAAETLCGQAYGAKNYPAIHDTLQRALLICGLTCIPISAAWLNAEWILTHLGQPVDIASGAAKYLAVTLPALYLHCIHECVDKYLLSQRVVKPSLAITAVSTALTPLFAAYFVVQQGLGLEGAGYAYCAVQACTTTMGLTYLLYRETVKMVDHPPEGYVPLRPSTGALANWGPYVALAVPAVMSYCMEGWATEVLIFLSGLLDNADVAVGVTGLALQFSTFVWLAAASIGSATSTRVANKLGRGDARGAERTAKTAVASVLFTQSLIGLAAFTYREPILRVMTSNDDVVGLAMTVMPVLACCFIADGLNVVQGAVLRGSGRQWWTAMLNLAGWWGVGVPLAYYLAIVQGGNAPGLWAGFATASALQSVLQFVAVNRFIDWDREVERAKEMMGDAPLPPESDDESSWDGDADREAREGSLPPERGWPAAKAAAAAAAAAAEGRELQAGAGAGPGSAVGREGAVGAVQVVQMERQEVGSNGHFKSQ